MNAYMSKLYVEFHETALSCPNFLDNLMKLFNLIFNDVPHFP